MVYVTNYYPAGTKFIGGKGELADVLEQGRRMTLSLQLRMLEEKVGTKLPNNLDDLVDRYASEETRKRYEKSRSYEQERHE